MYFLPIFLLLPLLALVAILGMLFAIIGTGHRKAWMLVLPIGITSWFVAEQVIALFLSSALFTIFWRLALPVIVSVAAWKFRRIRERPQT